MESFIHEVLKASLALFVIIDPAGNIPIFVGLTRGMSPERRRETLRIASLVAFVLLMVFALLGQRVLSIFGISLHSFMIAGGALLLILAAKILIYGKWEETTSPESIGAVPMACPLLAGPGAITATIVILETSGLAVALASVLIALGATWLVLRNIERIHAFLGTTGSAVIARIMAIFIAAIGVGFVVDGVKNLFP